MPFETTAPTVIVGVDATDSGRDALALGRMLAEFRGASVIAAAVYRREHPKYAGSRELENTLRYEAAQSLEDAVGIGADPVQMRTIAAASPARGLHELAEQTGAELVVVGSTHRGPVRSLAPGSTGARLLQEAPCAVAIAPAGYALETDREPRVIAAGYDLSEESEAALKLAAELAGAAECTIRILTVEEPHAERYGDVISGGVAMQPTEDVRDRLRMAVMRKRDELPIALRADASILRGLPGPALLAELEKGVDLVVMGSRGYGPIGRALLGTVAAQVVGKASCPVVIVPRAAAHASEPSEVRREAAVNS